MTEPFVVMLAEPWNSLGRTVEVVELIEQDPQRLVELYECYFQEDEWVRLRASSAFKRVWRRHPEWIVPYLDGWVNKVSCIDQASTQWTFAQLCLELQDLLSEEQHKTAIERLKGYVKKSDDWIVQNTVIATLGEWAKNDSSLKDWFIPKLEVYAQSSKKSVAHRARKTLKALVE